MFARLAIAWNRLTTSLWALPMAIVAAAAVAAAVSVAIDTGADPFSWLYSGDATAASSLLANLLTATITMATLAISITMVVLTLAARSLGPRLIQIFMADTRTKLILGLFIGTVVYLLIVLRSVVSGAGDVPNLAVTLGTLLVLTSVVVLLFFVHHLARSIVADTIVERVGQTLDDWILSRFPDAAARQASTGRSTVGHDGKPFTAPVAGYIQAIDHEAVVAAACKAQAAVQLHVRPGHFVLRDAEIGSVTPPTALDNSLSKTLTAAVVIGQNRTPDQDIEYPIRQLVEIALRALSAGVNDPYTAIAVIDRLAASIDAIMARGEPQTCWRDADDVVRLIAPTTDFDGVLDAAFNEIRQAGESQPAILIRLVDRLGQLLARADANRAAAIKRHIALARTSGQRSIADEADREAFLARAEAAVSS